MDTELFKIKDGRLYFIGGWPKSKEDALVIAVAKWEAIVEYAEDKGVLLRDRGRMTCGLCMLYWYLSCQGCPIMEDTGAIECKGTSYEDYGDAWGSYDFSGSSEVLIRGTEAAKEELAYLRELSTPKGNE